MIQIAGVPLSFCHRMSDLPSPLKSPASSTCQVGPGLAPGAAPPIRLVPSIIQIAGVPLSFCHRMSDLPSPLKSPASSTCQVGPGLEPGPLPTGDVGAVHGPDRRRPVVVLPQDVGLAVAVEIASVLDMPGRPRIGARAAATDRRWCRPSVQIAGVPLSFCHRMSDLPSPLKSPASFDMPGRSRIGQAPLHRSCWCRPWSRSPACRCRSAKGCRPCRRR